MTHSRPRRRTMRQCIHIFLTEAFTFIALFLNPSHDTRPSAIRIELEGDFVSHEHLYAMKPHFPREVRKNSLTIRYFYPEERIRERFINHSLNDLRFVRVNHSSIARN